MQVEQEKIPNEETIKSLEDSIQGIGVTSNSSVEEMMNEIYQELEEEGFKVKKHD
jgi:uncharacterized protein (DUF302 family)